ncbi:hypothetical protein VDF74_20460 [Xanthomonas campestris pv. raphani]|nr:hypothetical protein [Xanthomonas campestris]MEA9741273.1 hypothetical protein [Xanthomonas campestris pv. raphani]
MNGCPSTGSGPDNAARHLRSCRPNRPLGRFWFSGLSILHPGGPRSAAGRNAVVVADMHHRARVGADDGRRAGACVASAPSRSHLPAGRDPAQA